MAIDPLPESSTASAPPESGSGLRPDSATVERWWQRYAVPGEVYEVRITDSRQGGPARLFKKVAGYFNDGLALVKALSRITGRDAQNVYITLNPVDPALLARGNNRLVNDVKATASDEDVTRRRHFLIDTDPNRPSSIPATPAELAAALKARDAIRDYLDDLGWPAPAYTMMSGNGGALVYEIDLPNDTEALALNEGCLAALANAFGTEAVTVDQTVTNASRLTKVPGTVAAKGDDVPELGRVWRLAVAELHDHVASVSRERLEALAAHAPQVEALATPIFSGAVGHADDRSWTVTELLRRNGIGYFEKSRRYGTVYVLDRCLTSDAHGDGAAIIERPDGALGYRCQHNSCLGKGWQDAKRSLGLGAGEAGPAGPNGVARAGAPPSALRAEPAWPEPLRLEAFYGLLGEIVSAIEPHSEADRAALLAHAVTGAGALIGPNVYALAGDARHPARHFTVAVGETAKGRKGSAARPNERVLRTADEAFGSRISEGLSSGEGLIWQVRDPIYKMERRKGEDQPQEVLDDPGVPDKRLWLIESEFASTLRVLQREGNTLSTLVRRAWDTGTLATLTKNSPAKATRAHICITGHISKDELLRYLDRSELASGFVNRFLLFASRRGRSLPDGERVPDEVLWPLAMRLRSVMHWAASERVLRRDDEASAIWHRIYEPLSDGRPGMFGAATNRAEAQVLRLSVLYAALDCSDFIRADHLLAALAVWRYAEQSARWIFGDAIGDPIADTIMAALRQRSMSRNEIRELFGRNVSSGRIAQALGILTRYGLASVSSDTDTGGRPREVWHAA